MALELFLTISGVTGGCKSRTHKGWFSLSSYHWVLARSRQRGSEGSAARLVTTGNELKVVKRVGIESAALMELCATGKSSAQAQISIAPAAARREVAQKHVLIRLGDVYVKSITTLADQIDGFLTEELVLMFKKLEFNHHPILDLSESSMGAESDDQLFSWDFVSRRGAAPAVV